jgi:hypothetical protein
LRDVRHPIAAQALQLMLTQREHIVLADLHHPSRQPATTPGVTQQGQGDGGLAGSRLADQRQHFTFFQGEAHAFDDFRFTALATGDHTHVFNSNQFTHFNALPYGDYVGTTVCR